MSIVAGVFVFFACEAARDGEWREACGAALWALVCLALAR